MPPTFDMIVIGSGFGGAVNACRLAERGMRVLILERGRRWEKKAYPRELKDAWVYDNDHPEEQHGLGSQLWRPAAESCARTGLTLSFISGAAHPDSCSLRWWRNGTMMPDGESGDRLPRMCGNTRRPV